MVVNQPLQIDSDWDVVIVGSGPAGIAAAATISRKNPRAKVAVLERGHDIRRRPCPVDVGRKCRGCGGICNVISGFGGSVHYGDGVKLSMLPAGRRLIDLFGEPLAADLCRRAAKLFDEKRQSSLDIVGTPDSEAIRKIFHDYGVTPREYTVQVYSESEVQNVLRGFRKELEAATGVYLEHELQTVNLRDGVFEISCLTRGRLSKGDVRLSAKSLVLATGRAGISSTQTLLSDLGVAMSFPSYSVGVRVEMPAKYLRAIGTEFPDFKLSTSSVLNKTKTFCLCGGSNGGRIKFTNYQNQFSHEIVTLDGHESTERVQGERELSGNFGLLCQEEALEASANISQKFNRNVMAPYLDLSNGRPVAQSMRDFRAATSPQVEWETLEASLPFEPSVRDLTVAPLHRLFSSEQRDAILLSYDRVMAPALAASGYDGNVESMDESVVVIGLEIEFLWNKVKISDSCQTSVPGLFVAGDSAGLAQGVIQAAMMGIRVGDTINSEM